MVAADRCLWLDPDSLRLLTYSTETITTQWICHCCSLHLYQTFSYVQILYFTVLLMSSATSIALLSALGEGSLTSGSLSQISMFIPPFFGGYFLLLLRVVYKGEGLKGQPFPSDHLRRFCPTLWSMGLTGYLQADVTKPISLRPTAWSSRSFQRPSHFLIRQHVESAVYLNNLHTLSGTFSTCFLGFDASFCLSSFMHYILLVFYLFKCF